MKNDMSNLQRKWYLCNRLLNVVRSAKKIKLVDKNSNPYLPISKRLNNNGEV